MSELTVDPGYVPNTEGVQNEAPVTESRPRKGGSVGSFRPSTGSAPAIKVKSVLETLSFADGELINRMNNVFRSDYKVKKAMAAARQANVMRQLGRNRKSVDGMGQVVLEVDEELAGMLRVQYGRNCFHDPDFVKFLQRTYPELFKIQCQGTKIQVGWSRPVRSMSWALKKQSIAKPNGLICARN